MTCKTCGASEPHSELELARHRVCVAEQYKMAAIQARGEAVAWRGERNFQASQDRDYSKGRKSTETARCQGAVDALTQFAAHMDEKARDLLEKYQLETT